LKSKSNIVDLVIVGAGPAGLMAAVQARRQGLSIALLEKGRPGGQALAANRIENFPGFPEGMSGPDLVEKFMDQAKSHGVIIRHETVEMISKESGIFTVRTSKGNVSARTVIVASGLKPKRLGIPGEDELIGRCVFAYAAPSLVPHEGRRVTIIGSGDAAFDQALNFSRLAKSVTIATKHERPACTPALEKIVRDTGIEMLTSHVASSIRKMQDTLEVTFENGRSIETDVVITCAGKERNLAFLDNELANAKVEGLFFAGDCHRDLDRHIAIACGDGIAAAMSAAEYVSKRRTESEE